MAIDFEKMQANVKKKKKEYSNEGNMGSATTINGKTYSNLALNDSQKEGLASLNRQAMVTSKLKKNNTAVYPSNTKVWGQGRFKNIVSSAKNNAIGGYKRTTSTLMAQAESHNNNDNKGYNTYLDNPALKARRSTDPNDKAFQVKTNNTDVEDWTHENRMQVYQDKMAKADAQIEKGNAQLEEAKEGLGKLGQFGVDALQQGILMGSDMALSAVTGGVGGLAAMGVRSFGLGANEAAQDGATLDQQVQYGALSAAVETATEKLFQGVTLLNKAYGGGAISEEAISEYARRWAKNAAKTEIGANIADAAAKMGIAGVGEGLEEIIADAVNPVIKMMSGQGYDGQYTDPEYYKQMARDGLLGGVLGTAMGGGSAVIDYRKGGKITEDDLQTATEEALKLGEESDAYQKAVQYQQDVEEGKTVTEAQKAELVKAVAREQNSMTDDYNLAGAIGVSFESAEDVQLAEEALGDEMGTVAEEVQAVFNTFSVSQEGENEAISEENANGNITVSDEANMLAMTLRGLPLGNAQAQIQQLLPGNEAARSAFTKITGIQLPESNQGTIQEVKNYMRTARTDLQSSMYAKMNNKFSEVINTGAVAAMTTYGENGRRGFSYEMKQASDMNASDIKSTEAQKLSRLRSTQRAYNAYYAAGADATPETRAAILARLEKTWAGSGISKATRMKAFEAGQNDKADLQKRAAEAQDDEKNNAKTTVAKTGEVTNKSTQFTDNEVKGFEELAEVLKLKIVLEDEYVPNEENGDLKLDDDKVVNGFFTGNTLHIFNKSNRPYLFTVSHEFTHYLRTSAPKEYQAFADYVVNALYMNDPEAWEAEIQSKIKLYAESRQKLTRDGAIEEILADSAVRFFADEESIRNLTKANKTLAERLKDFIDKFLNSIKALMGNKDLKEYGRFYDELGILEKASKLYGDAIKAAEFHDAHFDSGGVRFSLDGKNDMSEPVEITDRMIAWHNMGEDAMMSALELGGLAMPSWAVKPANMAHPEFGDISVIAARDTVAPGRDAKIFNGDAWTPTFPNIDYEADSEGLYKVGGKIRELLGETASSFGNLALDPDNANSELKFSNGSFFDAFGHKAYMKYAYLKEKGIKVDEIFKEVPLEGGFGNDVVKNVYERIITKNVIDDMNKGGISYYKENPEDVEAIKDLANEEYEDKYNLKDFFNDNWDFSTYYSFVRAMMKYKESGITKKLDIRAMEKSIDDEISKNASDYKQWVNNLFKDVSLKKGIRNNKDPFTPSGNRRSFDQLHYEYSLANVVKAMKQQEVQGGTAAFTGGPKMVKGAALKSYKSLEEVRSELNKVVDRSKDIIDNSFDEFGNKVIDLAGQLTDDTLAGVDEIADILVHSHTKSGIYNYFMKEFQPFYKLDEPKMFCEDIYELGVAANELPIEYFEAKTYRAFPFSEAAGIVIPDTASEELKNKLKDANANVITYKTGDEEDRLAKVNSIDNVRFSISKNSDSDAGEEIKQAYGRENADIRYSINPKFDEQYDKWDKKKTGFSFILGETSDALKSIDVPDTKIRMSASKLIKIRNKHPEMTDEVIKQIPYILERPVIVMASNSHPDKSIVLYGSVYGNNKKPVMVALMLNNNGVELVDFLVSSAYTRENRNNLQNRLNTDKIYYVDPNKKRTDTWLNVNRLQLPLRNQQYGSLNSITQDFKVSKRYSISPADNEKLVNKIDNLKKELKRTDLRNPKQQDVQKLARAIIKDFGMNKSEMPKLEKAITSMFRELKNPEGEDFDNIADEAILTANDVMQSITTVIGDQEYFNSVRKTIKSQSIAMSKQDAENIPDFREYVKANRKYITLSNNGRPVDTVYAELAELYPELFSLDIMDPSEQLMTIVDNLKSIEPETVKLVDTLDRNDTMMLSSEIGNTMVDGLYELGLYQSFADKKAQQKADAVRKERAKAAERVQKLKEKAKTEKEKARQKKKDAVLEERAKGKEKLADLKAKQKAYIKEMKNISDVRAIAEQFGRDYTLQPGEVNRLTYQLRQAMAKAGKPEEAVEHVMAAVDILTESKAGGNILSDDAWDEVVEAVANPKRDKNFRNTYGDQIARLKNELAQTKLDYAKRNKDRQTSKKRRETIEKIKKSYERLSAKLQNPTDTNHLPDGFEKAVADFLAPFDFATDRTDPESKAGKAREEQRININDLAKRLNEAANDQEGTSIVVDFVQAEFANEIAGTLQNKRVSELSDYELEKAYQLIKNLEKIIYNVNQSFTEGISKGIAERASQAVDEIKERNKVYKKSGLGDTINSYITSNVKPRDFFRVLTKEGGALYEAYMAVRKAFNRHINNMTDFRNAFERAVNYKQVKAWRKESTRFKLESGQEIRLTVPQIMSLYELNKREQARGHIYGVGLVASDEELSRKAKKEDKGGKNRDEFINKRVNVTYNDIVKITSTLTDEQRAAANKLQKIMSGMGSAWGNEASLTMYNFRKFTEQDYFPITVLNTWLDEKAGVAQPQRLRTLGMTKKTTPNANNPLVVDDIFSVTIDHMNKMSMYTMTPELTDFERIWNYKDKEAGVSLREEFEAAYGKNATAYVRNLMNNINGYFTRDDNIMFFDQMLSKFKRAKVGASLRVLVQQPTSIIRAATQINGAYLARAIPGNTIAVRKNMQEMWAHNATARWKSWGFYETDTAKSMESIVENKRELADITMGPYGLADNMTWATIWQAVKLETSKKHKDVKKGSDEYWKIVNERFDEIVDYTQVVDSVFHRSQIMRSKNVLAKGIAAFMSEPTTTVNMLRTECLVAAQESEAGEKGKAAKRISKVISTLVINGVAVSAAAALVDAMRHSWAGDDDDEEDKNKTLVQLLLEGAYEKTGVEMLNKIDEGLTKWKSHPADEDMGFLERWLVHTKKNLPGNINPLQMLPGIKDVFSLIDGYSVERADISLISNIIDCIDKFERYMNGNSSYSLWYILNDMLGAVGDYAGVPYRNAFKDAQGIARTVAEAMGHGDYSNFIYNSMMYSQKSWNQEAEAKSYINAIKKGNTEDARKIKEALQNKYDVSEEDFDKKVEDVITNGLSDAITGGDRNAITEIRGNLITIGYTSEEADEVINDAYTKALRDALEVYDANSVRMIANRMSSAGFTKDDIKTTVKNKYSSAYKDAYIAGNRTLMRQIEQASKAAGLSSTDFESIKAVVDKDLYKIAVYNAFQSGNTSEYNRLMSQASKYYKNANTARYGIFEQSNMEALKKEYGK